MELFHKYRNFFSEKGFAELALDLSHMFLMGEDEAFQQFLRDIFQPEQPHIPTADVDLFLSGEFRLTEMDMNIIKDITDAPENISLLYDQKDIFYQILPLLKKQAEGRLDKKQMIVISGGVGTGKTIIGFKILAEYWNLHSGEKTGVTGCMYTFPRSKTLLTVLRSFLPNIPFQYLDQNDRKQHLLVIDEAHRIPDMKNLEEKIHGSEIVVILQDDRQRVMGNEAGNLENFRTFAESHSDVYDLHCCFLKDQKRSGAGYVDRLKKMLYGEDEGQNAEPGIDVKIDDSIEGLES